MTDKIQKLGLSDEIRTNLIGGADMPSLTGTYNGVGDGAADDTAAVNAASAAGTRTYVPPGVYDTTLAFTDVDAPLVGVGQVQTALGNRLAPDFAAVKAPLTEGNPDSFNTAFNGDVSKCRPVSHYVSGATTLGTNPAIYNFPYMTCGHVEFIYVDYNAGSDGDVSGLGRTGVAMHRDAGTQAGHGDAYNYHAALAVKNPSPLTILDPTKPIMPAGVHYGGEMVLLDHNGFLNSLELHVSDLGFRGSAAPSVVVLNRANADASLDGAGGPAVHFWIGYSAQSDGAVASDIAFRTEGKWSYGFSTTEADLGANKAAIGIKSGDRIYFAASSRTSGSIHVPGPTGNTWIGDEFGFLNFVYGGSSKLQISGGQSLVLNPLVQTMSLTTFTPSGNDQMSVQKISNTVLRFKFKGSDGVVRTSDMTFV